MCCAAINFSAGTKFGFPENYATLVSRGGPTSSIQGTRTTNAKVGAPPRPPVFQYSFDSKRSDAPKSGGAPAPKAGAPAPKGGAPAPKAGAAPSKEDDGDK